MVPKGMDSEFFLKTFGDDQMFNEPWIYCLRQEPQIPVKPYYRCGAAGTQLFPDADRPYQASENSRKGLSGRVTQYIGHIRPNKVIIFAAIRIKKAVVALPGQRLGGDDESGLYNITRGNQSAVLAAERVMHTFLDNDPEINRFPDHPDSELFRPSQGVEQLLKNMRRVQGLEMILFDEKDWRIDPSYNGGDARQPMDIKDVQRRAVPKRESKIPSLIIKLDKAFIEQLRSGNFTMYTRLVNIIKDVANLQDAGVIPKKVPAPPPPPAPPAPPPPPAPPADEIVDDFNAEELHLIRTAVHEVAKSGQQLELLEKAIRRRDMDYIKRFIKENGFLPKESPQPIVVAASPATINALTGTNSAAQARAAARVARQADQQARIPRVTRAQARSGA